MTGTAWKDALLLLLCAAIAGWVLSSWVSGTLAAIVALILVALAVVVLVRDTA